MNPQNIAYDSCRCFIQDHSGLIDEEIIQLTLGWVRSRNLSSLCSADVLIARAYSCERTNRFSRQIAAFFKKNAAFSDERICDEQAEISFFKAETVCRITNRRLDHYDKYPHRLDDEVATVVEKSRNIIRDILGDIGPFLSELKDNIRLTSGATATLSRRQSLPHLKVNIRSASVTSECRPFFESLMYQFGAKKVRTKSIYFNRVETVPKNYKTARTIACEPEGNLLFQLAFDKYAKQKLRYYGINLSCQERNQKMAREGSISNNYATVDLSQASDTIAFNAVALLLPSDWFQYVKLCRTSYGKGFGQTFKYEKFSSMGNGSTFAIETLIFFAVSLAISKNRKETCVYGDDIILKKEHYPLLLKVMKHLGFSINKDKTFSDGPFRESCGTDWFLGRDVTPFYLRSKTHGKPELCHIVNGLARIAFPDSRLEKYLLSLVNDNKLPLVPFSEDSMIGVWIDTHTAYKLKVIQTKHSISYIKAYVAKSPVYNCVTWQTYFLWHLDASRRVRLSQSYDDIEIYAMIGTPTHRSRYISDSSVCITRSKVPLLSHKYRQKRVSWIPPAQATPVHLYRWSDQIVHNCRRLE